MVDEDDEEGQDKDAPDDPLYNLLDNYAALLCLAFMHAQIIDALCFLGSHGEFSVAIKSRSDHDRPPFCHLLTTEPTELSSMYIYTNPSI